MGRKRLSDGPEAFEELRHTINLLVGLEGWGKFANQGDATTGANAGGQVKRLRADDERLFDFAGLEEAACLVGAEDPTRLVPGRGKQAQSLVDAGSGLVGAAEIEEALAGVHGQIRSYVATYWCLSALWLCRVE